MPDVTLIAAPPSPHDECEIGLPASNASPRDPASAGTHVSPEVERLREELKRLLEQQQELMQLLGTKRPDKLAHDLRNLLQERMFLEAACKRFGG